MVADQLVGERIDHVLHYAGNKPVSQRPDVPHGFPDIQGEALAAGDPLFLERVTPMEVVGDLNQDLGWHASDACTHRSQGSTVDHHEIVGHTTNLRQGMKAGGAGTQDGNADISMRHRSLPYSLLSSLRRSHRSFNFGTARLSVIKMTSSSARISVSSSAIRKSSPR